MNIHQLEHQTPISDMAEKKERERNDKSEANREFLGKKIVVLWC